MSSDVQIPEFVRRSILRAAERLYAATGGIRAVVIATSDGFDVAAISPGHDSAARVAATASSIAAVGQAVSQETGMGLNRSIVLDCEQGFIVLAHAHYEQLDLVVSVVAGRDAVLAQITYRIAQFEKWLSES